MPRAPEPAALRPAAMVLVAGVAAALHVGKLPPALPALQQALGLTLLQAGFLLSLVQGAGMLAGVGFGALADRVGARASMLAGLLLLAAASVAGSRADSAAALLALRAVEGCGFLLVVLPAPGLLRRLVPPDRLGFTMGVWGGYMPLATALALLCGPVCIALAGWRNWWLLLGVLTAGAAWLLARGVPADGRGGSPATHRSQPGAAATLRQTLASPGPWLVATPFAAYSAQWLAVIGFLPTLCAEAGFGPAATGGLTALVALANLVGNLAGGRALQRGVRPLVLLAAGFGTMAVAAMAAFAGLGNGDGGSGLPPLARYAAVLVFSGAGGLIPATLFAAALQVAPSPAAVSATVGWVQQWSALGQFAGPPLVAWVAARAGGWQFTGLATAACALAGLALAALLSRRLRAG